MQPIKDLSSDAVDVKPIDFDWSEGYGDTWEYWEACHCDACGAVVLGRKGDRHCDMDNESDCRGSLSGDGPMMSYWYPLAIADEEEAARTIVDLPLCVVRVNGETGLALTGGGMDLSWEICEAYMLLGHLPPFHFCDLPRMAGKDLGSTRNRRVISGALESARIVARRAEHREGELYILQAEALKA